MIIDVQEIVEKYTDSSLREENIELVENILEIIFSSYYHIPKMLLRTYFKLIEKNKETNFLSKNSRNRLNELYSNATITFNEISNLPCIVKIIEEDSRGIFSEEIEYNKKNITIFTVPLKEIEKENFERVHFLVENIKDYNIYLKLSEILLEKRKMSFFKLDFYPDNGSGNEIGVQYNSTFVNKKNIGICVVDSDKKYPNSDYGNTFQKLYKEIKESQKNKRIIFKLLELKNQREMENFIPLELLKYLCKSSFYDKRKFNNILFDIRGEYYNYMDLKEGLPLKDFINDNKFYNFWKESFKGKVLGNFSNGELKFNNFEEVEKYITEKKFETLQESDREKETEKINSTYLCKGYKNSISDKLYEFLSNNEIEKLKEMISKNEKNEKIPKDRKNNLIKEKNDKINMINELKNKIFENRELEYILETIILWGVQRQGVKKISN